MRFVILAALALAFSAKAEDMELRRELERTYSSWRAAIAAHDVAGWQKTSASYRQAVTRNLIVSQKQPFPAALFSMPMRPPDTGTLKLVKAQAKGATAHLIYFGRVDLGISEAAEVPENLLVLKFIKDADGWKFDTTRLINLANAPEIRAELKNAGSSPYLNEPELEPTGIVPATPAPCQMGDHIALLQITSIGYKTTAHVNGFELPTVADTAEQHLIIGGLKTGETPLKLDVTETPVPEGESRELEINAVVLTGEESKPSIRVFTWKQNGPAPAKVDQIIHVNRLTMRGM